MEIDIKTMARRLLDAEDVLVLSHRRPDGDSIGSSFGLYYILKSLGKRARVECADGFPDKFSYLYENYTHEDFEPRVIVAADTATKRLLGELMPLYGDRVDLCIDHHKSNEMYAKESFVDTTAPATAEIVYLLTKEMGVALNTDISNALYTGIITDTGGFRFASVTARTHVVASKLIEGGANNGEINQLIFESNTKGRLEVEGLALESMEYHMNDRVAVLYLPSNLKEIYGVLEEELDGIASLPRTVKGVDVGITIRDLGAESFRISLRTLNSFDASRICRQFGGGGHVNAAGCTMFGTLKDVKSRLLKAAKDEIERGKE